MTHATRALLLATCLVLMPSCGDPLGVPDGVRITTSREAVFVSNGTEQGSVFSIVIPEDELPLADWIPCITSGSCGEVLPGATRRISAESLGSAPGEVVFVYWWRAVPGPADAPEAGPISSERVVLRSSFTW